MSPTLTPNYPTVLRLPLYLLGFVMAALLSTGCQPKLFQDANSLTSFENLKNQAVALVSKSDQPYSDHAAQVDALKNDMTSEIAKQKERGEKNGKTVQMLELLMDEGSNLLGGVLKRWKSEGSLSSGFAGEAAKLVGENFDKVINLEKSRPAAP
ncbi:MAG: hypothetical protein AAFV95_26770 [Bacteroidota bacterium]